MIVIRPGLSVSGPDGVTIVQGQPYGETRTLKRADALVIHETVTRSAKVADAVLRKRGLSVQLVCDEGAIIQHEPLLVRCSHAGAERNPIAYGVEVVNPYYPRNLRPGLVWTESINAQWAHEGAYVLPTPDQAESVASLIRWATSSAAGDARITDSWPGVSSGYVAMGRIDNARVGVLAHTYFGHADGAWLVLYAWLRIKAGLDPKTAYSEAKRRATGVRRVDVRDLA